MEGEQLQDSQQRNKKQLQCQLSKIFGQCQIDEKEMKDQSLRRSGNQYSQRSNGKLSKILRSWSLQQNIIFLTFLVENHQEFEEEIIKQKHKIFYLMSKRIKVRVSSVCCSRFYQLYKLCSNNLDSIIRRMSEFISKQKRKKEKESQQNDSIKGLLEINNAQTDSQYHKIINQYVQSIPMQQNMEEICYK